MSIGALRKWHCDLAAGSGEVLWAEFSSIRLAGFSWGMAEAFLMVPGGGILSDREAGLLSCVRPSPWPRFRGHRLERMDGGLHAAMDFPSFRFDLLYDPMARGWVPGGPTDGRGAERTGLQWESPDIRARVEGTFDAGSGAVKILGTGFVDMMSAAFSLGRRSAAPYLRGRAHFPSETVVFGQFPTEGGSLRQNILLRRERGDDAAASVAVSGNCRQRLRWVEDVHFFVRATGTEGALAIVHPLFTLTLTGGHVLGETPETCPSRAGRSAPMVRFLDRLGGAASRERVAASACLELAGRTALGTALYERGQWTSGSA
jgi:hypothetical protein